MVREISFIHAADLHLDSPFKGLQSTPEHLFQEIKESTFRALDRLISYAIQKQVDFVLIVGDLFDNEKQSLKAQVRLRRAFEELKRHHIQVYLSHGNHDFINGNIHDVIYPDNVHIFPSEAVSNFTFQKGNEDVAQIYGFSYENRAVTSEKAEEYKIDNKDIPFHIATLHGSIRSNTDHDVYAPFQLAELEKEPFDYWALGHIHKREILKEKPPIIYPGNIQGRNRKETGMKGCYYVELTEMGSELTFIPLHSIRFQHVDVDLTRCKNLHEAEVLVQQSIANENLQERALLDLSIHGNSFLQEKAKYLEELIEIVNESIAYQDEWKYIIHYSIHVKGDPMMNVDLEKGGHFVGEVIRQAEIIDMQESLKDLYHHKKARRYLDDLSAGDRQALMDDAKALLVHELWKG